ncbi:MAG: low molecular weight protein-tyrosine-phosphatase [Micropruina sp.]
MIDIVFVCWGNICRSPMAERVAQGWAEREGLDAVRFSSAGTSSEELGEPIDARAQRVLAQAGYSVGGHRAHQISATEIRTADLVIAMEDLHLSRIRRLVPDADNLSLLTDFDPDAEPGAGVPDPWYGSADGFRGTLAAIEAAMPGVLDKVREITDRRS